MAARIVLPAELTVIGVAALRDAWLAALARTDTGDAVAVDAGAVEEVDAAGVQLLLSLQRQLLADGAALRLVDPSHTLRAACEALGVAARLGVAR